ncbi:MAG: CAP domain-containing protein [Syntrophomonadaceae bacterium]|jgi:uncharacterized YkwD family protein
MKKILYVSLVFLLLLAPIHNAAAATGDNAVATCFKSIGKTISLDRIKVDSSTSGLIKVYINDKVYYTRDFSGLLSKFHRGSKPAAPTSKPAPAPTPAPKTSVKASDMQTEMLGYINAARAKVNAAPLTLDKALSDGAYLKSKDMAVNKYFDHNSPTYGSPFAMMSKLGIDYRTAGENIAKNISVKGAHEAFMNSPGHKANILNKSYKKIGLGFYQSGQYLYVTQWFTD